ncbi:hypothetical protein CHS0354_036214 [Potamilus streckersoni]|uniref:MARVEL domain-containing protein n=1 Tax=Potamilus streckersoni TaxID=2493646 RepID=A0AAE0W3B0_9BIVA|nr:hypothetical protein CHS0354_036214 [Potamilus streckersoni]
MSTHEHSTNTPRAQSSRNGIFLDRDYFRTLNGILKIPEMILDIAAFICASVWQDTPFLQTYRSSAAGWVMFATMSAFITTLIITFLHLFRIIYKLPGPWGLIEPIYCCAYSVMMLIAGIVAAVDAKRYGFFESSITATACFTCSAFAVYCVNTIWLFICWCRSGTPTEETVTTATRTSTISRTTYEA